jgi:hypothetical protein
MVYYTPWHVNQEAVMDPSTISDGTAAKKMPPKLDKETATGRIQVVAPASWVKRVDDWRRRHPEMPNRSKAVRMMVDLYLESETKKSRR